MTGKVVRTVNVQEAGCFAAACTAGVGLGLCSDVTEPILALVRPLQVFEPRPAHQDRYDAGAARYRDLYATLAETPQGARCVQALQLTGSCFTPRWKLDRR
jgi:sugar (pentulose or hexulose) kinase